MESLQALWTLTSRQFFEPDSQQFWPWLGLCIFVGLLFAWRREGARSAKAAFGYVFPRKLYFSRSTAADIGILVLNAVIFEMVLGQLLGLRLSDPVYYDWLSSFFGATGAAPRTGVGVDVLFAASAALAFEAAWFIHHYAFHNVPALWAFHKVHHSPLTLTPFSTKRFHPLELTLLVIVVEAFNRLNLLVFGFFGLQPSHLGWLGSLFFILFAAFSALRHSHIPLSFGRMEAIFFSPYLHQLHHSCKPEHVNKNYGFFLTLPDRLCGTLYIPKPGEELVFGLGSEDEASSRRYAPGMHLIYPLLDGWRVLRRGEFLSRRRER